MFTVLIGGCGVAPIRQEFNLPEQRVDAPLENTSQIKLVIYNDSNKLMYSIDGSGKINISIDNKGAGQLRIGRFIVLALERGNHKIQLHHRDVFNFKSNHLININNPVNYLKIYSKISSNGAEIVDQKPDNFDTKFVAAYSGKQ